MFGVKINTDEKYYNDEAQVIFGKKGATLMKKHAV